MVKYWKSIQIDTLRKIVNTSWRDIFRTCVWKAMDNDRVKVSVEEIENNLNELSQAIQNVPHRYCFNIDEMGRSKFADAVSKKVIIPFNCIYKEAQIPVDCLGKHSSI